MIFSKTIKDFKSKIDSFNVPDEGEVFVSTRVSFTIFAVLLAGVWASLSHHWSYSLIAISVGFILAGFSAMANWRIELLDEGEAPLSVLENTKHAVILPMILLMISGILLGWNINHTIGVSILTGAFHFLGIYTAGFWKVDPEYLRFETHPFSEEEYAFMESTYIEHVENKATEVAKEKGYYDE